MNTPETTWPTPREHLAWGTSEIQLVREHLTAGDPQLAALARQLQRPYLSVRARRLRLLQLLR